METGHFYVHTLGDVCFYVYIRINQLNDLC